MIGIVAAAGLTMTDAYFSDTESSDGNTLYAGTIDLAVNGVNPLDSAIVTIADIKPGQNLTDIEVVLNNVGENDGNADLYIAVGVSDEGTDSEPECEAENKTWNSSARECDGTESENENICTQIEYDYCYDIDDNAVCDTTDPQGIFAPPLDVDLGVLPAAVSSGSEDGTRLLWLSHHLSSGAGNEYQGDECTWDIDFTLKQIGYGE